MPRKPVGPLKRFRSEESSDNDDNESSTRRSKRANFCSAEKHFDPNGAKSKAICDDGGRYEKLLPHVVLRADSACHDTHVVRGSSIKKAVSFPPQNSDALAKSPAEKVPIHKAKKLAREELEVSMEDVARKLLANNHHDLEGVRVLGRTHASDAAPESLPFMFLTVFQTYTR